MNLMMPFNILNSKWKSWVHYLLFSHILSLIVCGGPNFNINFIHCLVCKKASENAVRGKKVPKWKKKFP